MYPDYIECISHPFTFTRKCMQAHAQSLSLAFISVQANTYRNTDMPTYGLMQKWVHMNTHSNVHKHTQIQLLRISHLYHFKVYNSIAGNKIKPPASMKMPIIL